MLGIFSTVPFHLIVECPSLLGLRVGGEDDDHYSNRAPIAPSLKCPRLTSLHLSKAHSPAGVLEAIAAHAPEIEQFKTYVNEENPILTLTRFKGLRDLTVLEGLQMYSLAGRTLRDST